MYIHDYWRYAIIELIVLVIRCFAEKRVIYSISTYAAPQPLLLISKQMPKLEKPICRLDQFSFLLKPYDKFVPTPFEVNDYARGLPCGKPACTTVLPKKQSTFALLIFYLIF